MREVLKEITMLHFCDLQRLEVVSNRTTLTRWIAELGFPAPVKLGKRSLAWRTQDVHRWLAARQATGKVTPPAA